MDPTFLSVAPVYPVDDVEASIEWYRAMLGLEAIYVNRDEEDDDPTNYAVLQRDHVTLHLVRRAELEVKDQGRADAQFSIAGDIDAFFESLRAKGAVVLQSPRNQPWECRDFVVADPCGNKVWISTRQSRDQ